MTLDPQLLLNSMKRDLDRVLTAKTELFMRDNLAAVTVEHVRSPVYVDWMQKSRLSHALIFGMVDRLEGRSDESFRKFTDGYLRYDCCVCLYRASLVRFENFGFLNEKLS